MNRRSFFKVLTGYVAGVFAVSAKSERVQPKWVRESFRRQSICRPKPADPFKEDFQKALNEVVKDKLKCENGTFCPRRRFNEDSWTTFMNRNIDPGYPGKSKKDSYIKTPWEKLGCKDCFVECEHFEECKAILEERVKGV